jgi:pimeloyl-ACP methyl ester carboxylesterase
MIDSRKRIIFAMMPLLASVVVGMAAHSQPASAVGLPRSGRIVDIGAQRLFVDCRGTGSPTVLLEAGAGDFSLVWVLVQGRVATFTRVCSYDRGGYLWSEPGQRPRTYAQLALELRTALDRSGVGPPYVLVGQSYGGLVVRGFASRYPSDVDGMVLVDAVHEDERIVYGGEAHRLRDAARGRPYPEPRIALDTQFVRMARDSAALPPQPLPRPLDRLPADAQHAWRTAQGRPLYRLVWAAEMDWSPEELIGMHRQRLSDRQSLGHMPLIVLARTSGEYDKGLGIAADSLERERRFYAVDLAALSSDGQLVFAKASGHNIHIEDPALVIRSIRSVVQRVRANETRKTIGAAKAFPSR